MKYVFILLLFYAVLRLFVLKNVVNKMAFVFLCFACVLAGATNLFFEISFFDLIKGVLK